MKKLQNSFTTIEQSRRLLELGIPADSADCFYINDEYTPHVRDELYERNTGYKFPFSEEGFAPCWSVGRLAEIYNIITVDYLVTTPELDWEPGDKYNYVDYIIELLEDVIKKGLFNIFKLEEE